jgi:hypothetical protein
MRDNCALQWEDLLAMVLFYRFSGRLWTYARGDDNTNAAAAHIFQPYFQIDSYPTANPNPHLASIGHSIGGYCNTASVDG